MQLTILGDLEGQLNRSISELDEEEAVLRSREDFIERRRRYYLHMLNGGKQGDDYDSSDDEGEDEQQGEERADGLGQDPSKDGGEVRVARVTTDDDTAAKEEHALGSIKVRPRLELAAY